MKFSDEWKTLSLSIPVDGHTRIQGHLYHRDSFPVNDPGPLLVILQGRNEYMGMYEHLFPYLTQSRYWGKDFFLFDWRGQGESEGSRGHCATAFQFVDDLHLVLQALQHRGFSSFRFLAHSTGGFICLSYLFRYATFFKNPVHCDLISPFLDFPQQDFSKKIIQGLGWLGQNLYPAFLRRKFQSDEHFFAQEKQGLGHDLTDCKELSSRYFNPQLKCGSPTWGWLYSMLILQDYLRQEIQKYQTQTHPTHVTFRIVMGKEDTVVSLPAIDQTVTSLKRISDWSILEVITVAKKHSVLCDLGADLETLLSQLFSMN
jgi:alpha-beta hydrolase superfamily lysophospholipase